MRIRYETDIEIVSIVATNDFHFSDSYGLMKEASDRVLDRQIVRNARSTGIIVSPEVTGHCPELSVAQRRKELR